MATQPRGRVVICGCSLKPDFGFTSGELQGLIAELTTAGRER
jgi:hypothetical protein